MTQLRSSQLIWMLLLVVVLFAAGLFRLYQLGTLPAGMTWDEAAIGYNGYAIWETRRDEWLERLPISFRSFGDYKAPLAIYLSAVVTHVLDLTTFSVRLPFAIAGIATVIGTMGVSFELTRKFAMRSSLQPQWWALIAGMLTALSPWHVLFSRVGFESGIALCFLVWSAWIALYGLRQTSRIKIKTLSLIGSATLLSLTLYTYHSAKVFVPVALMVMTIYCLWQKRRRRILASYIAIVIVLLMPLLYDSFLGEGLTRAGVTVFGMGYSIPMLVSVLLSNIVAHVSPSFLVFGATDSLRHSTGVWGILLPTTALFVLAGVISLFWTEIKRVRGRKPQITQQLAGIATTWIVIGLLPAVIGQEVPHPNRALLAIPGFILMALIGIDWIVLILSRFGRKITFAFGVIIISVHSLLFLQFWQYYVSPYQLASSPEFIDGYQRMFERVWQIHDGESQYQPVDQFLISSEYGQPYIYALFTRKITPLEYHGGYFSRFLFPDAILVGDLLRENTILVFGPQSTEIDPRLATEVITDTSGEPMFYLIYTGDTNE